MNDEIRKKMNDDGVSETIAGILLIGLTVVGVTLISVVLFSQPMAEETPSVDVLVSNNGSTIYFQHNGGDSLGSEDFTIYVKGVAVEPDDLSFQGSGDGTWPWSVGETMQYSAVGDITPLDENVRITYHEETGVLLQPAFVDDAGAQLADVTSTPLPTLSPGSGPSTVTPGEAGEIVAASVLNDSHIVSVFASLEQTAIVEDKFFNFTVVSPDSTIKFQHEADIRDLSTGDRIVIRTEDDQAAGNRISISGVGKTFFNLRFEKVNVWINGVQIEDKNKENIEIMNAWIPEYEDLESTLAFNLGGKNKEYQLYIDGVFDSRGETGEEITLDNVRPTESGMFVIDAWSPNDNENSVILAEADIV